MDKKNLIHELESIKEYWEQKKVTKNNGVLLKLAKGHGEIHSHKHKDEDETFMVLEGELVIITKKQTFHLGPLEVLTIEKNNEHKVIAKNASFIILGKSITSNFAGGKPETRK